MAQSHYLRALLAKSRRPRFAAELEVMLKYLEVRDARDPTRFRSVLPWEMERRLEAIEASPVEESVAPSVLAAGGPDPTPDSGEVAA